MLDAGPTYVRETNARIAVVGEVFPEARSLEERWKSSPVRESILWRDEYITEEEMARWLAACDVVVLPYRYVSGSGIAARAIAARRPMAAASVGGLAETVRAGVTGELFDAGDPGALADAVRRIVDSGISAYEGGLTQAAEESSWARYVERLLAFFSSVDRRGKLRRAMDSRAHRRPVTLRSACGISPTRSSPARPGITDGRVSAGRLCQAGQLGWPASRYRRAGGSGMDTVSYSIVIEDLEVAPTPA